MIIRSAVVSECDSPVLPQMKAPEIPLEIKMSACRETTEGLIAPSAVMGVCGAATKPVKNLENLFMRPA